MNFRWEAGAAVVLSSSLILGGCTGGQESSAAEENAPPKNSAMKQEAQPPAVDASKELKDISQAIPIYAGAKFRPDLTRRDEVMIRNQYGPQSEVYTLATDDSYPQVYHYYTTYLAQFRAFPPQVPYPPERQDWRTLEVQLNQAMQDPFIPGDTIQVGGRQVLLQIAETEAEPKTVIRYIVTPTATAAAQQTAVVGGQRPVVNGQSAQAEDAGPGL
ncbi:MAG TPA: hypothetical protein VGR02_06705 [Thermoanaerobaculia bacterium]|jgi:hypothetical protein|nr:hypothetical protein [Thermoanaerobaculia bacterium]